MTLSPQCADNPILAYNAILTDNAIIIAMIPTATLHQVSDKSYVSDKQIESFHKFSAKIHGAKFLVDQIIFDRNLNLPEHALALP